MIAKNETAMPEVAAALVMPALRRLTNNNMGLIRGRSFWVASLLLLRGYVDGRPFGEDEIAYLAEYFSVSRATIRRRLRSMAATGLILLTGTGCYEVNTYWDPATADRNHLRKWGLRYRERRGLPLNDPHKASDGNEEAPE